jgi:DNA mismatch repair protein MutS
LYGYVRPTYVEHEDEDGTQQQGLEVVGLRHPIVERVHTSVPYVSHSLSFGCFHSETAEENKASTPAGLLLYGVNAAGKSSLGKAVGLAVLMAQIGMPVPATTMRLVPYTGLFTRILGNDDLWLGMSSFVVEMTELRSILKYADERSLVIGDELCAGTETDSAVALVSAGVQTLEKRGVHFLFATHLHELELGQELGPGLEDVGKHQTRSYHLSVKAVGSALQYDRLLKQGSGSDMYGLEVCRGLDMDAEFLTLAFQIRKRRCGDAIGKPSRYNALVTVSSCSVCGATEGLETHHLVPQAKAKATEGRIAAGVSKNVVSNLAVLCEACHLKHHKGLLEIGGWKQTTEGRVLG